MKSSTKNKTNNFKSLLIGCLAAMLISCGSPREGNFLIPATKVDQGSPGGGDGPKSNVPEIGTNKETPGSSDPLFKDDGVESVDTSGPASALPPVSLPAPSTNAFLIAAPNGLNQPVAVRLAGPLTTNEGVIADPSQIIVAMSHKLIVPPLAPINNHGWNLNFTPGFTIAGLHRISQSAWADSLQSIDDDNVCNRDDVTCCGINADGSIACAHTQGLPEHEDKTLRIAFTDGKNLSDQTNIIFGEAPNNNLHYLHAAPQKADRVAGELNLLSVKEGLSFGQRLSKTNGRLRVMGSFEGDYRDESLPEVSSNISELRRDAAGRVLLRDTASGIRFKDEGDEETLTVDNTESYSRLIRMRDGKIAVGVQSSLDDNLNFCRKLYRIWKNCRQNSHFTYAKRRRSRRRILR
jgi:hypothetical protein